MWRHFYEVRRFLEAVGRNPESITKDEVRTYLKGFVGENENTYANVPKSLRVFFKGYLGRGRTWRSSVSLRGPFGRLGFPLKRTLAASMLP